ncbi:hypothetical protein APY94_02335 [Thermococcus celericrescens]|uniref:Uncharacterized protein n=1 Tax=Thermococcus celericrescens TaxID=227598 RepID=A0A124EBK2_9EURY|nr:hypothetical protein [Thermococcus celericrescens]KUH34317.1 hypothetical protein APY94_02335 [Thermococcus celericrescens]
MDREKKVQEIRNHSVYAREIYEMHSESIDEVLENYDGLKEDYLNDHSRARIVRIVFNEDNGLPLAIEFNRKDDSFKGFTIAIGKPHIRSNGNGKKGENHEVPEASG